MVRAYPRVFLLLIFEHLRQVNNMILPGRPMTLHTLTTQFAINLPQFALKRRSIVLMLVDALVQIVVLNGTIHAMIDGVRAEVDYLLHCICDQFVTTFRAEVLGTRTHAVYRAASFHLLQER